MKPKKLLDTITFGPVQMTITCEPDATPPCLAVVTAPPVSDVLAPGPAADILPAATITDDQFTPPANPGRSPSNKFHRSTPHFKPAARRAPAFHVHLPPPIPPQVQYFPPATPTPTTLVIGD